MEEWKSGVGMGSILQELGPPDGAETLGTEHPMTVEDWEESRRGSKAGGGAQTAPGSSALPLALVGHPGVRAAKAGAWGQGHGQGRAEPEVSRCWG